MDTKQRFVNLPLTGVIIQVFCFCLIITSCSSGTTGSDSNRGGSALFYSEISDCSSPPSNSVYLCRNNSMSTEDIIAVDVHLNSDAPVFGAAFDLLLDQSSVEVVRKEDRSVDFSLPENPQSDSKMWKHLFVALNEDTLIIGASRGKELGPITGDIPVVTLKFNRHSSSSPLYFSNNSIIDETGTPLEIPEDRWFGGYFTPEQ